MAALVAYYLVFYLNLHACTARLLMLADNQLPFGSKDVETSNIGQLDNHKFFSVEQGQNNEGKKTKGAHSWKILHQDTEAKIWKGAERPMVESSASNSEENVSTKDKGTVEDIVVMDYAQPHRKPPIHNKGT